MKNEEVRFIEFALVAAHEVLEQASWHPTGGSASRAPDFQNLNRSKLFIRRTYTDFSFLGEAKQTHTEEVGSDDEKKAGTIGVLEAHELSQKDDSEQQGGAKSAAQRRKDTSVQ